jgi:hypothetical protein
MRGLFSIKIQKVLEIAKMRKPLYRRKVFLEEI